MVSVEGLKRAQRTKIRCLKNKEMAMPRRLCILNSSKRKQNVVNVIINRNSETELDSINLCA